MKLKLQLKSFTIALAALGTTMFAPVTLAAESSIAKNVMVFISDGASWGTWDIASYYQHGALGHQSYDSFDVKLGMTTFPLNTSTAPTYNNTQTISYNPSSAWNTAPTDGGLQSFSGWWEHHFAGYDYIKRDFTDSAAAATALASGQKTYNNAINYDNFGLSLDYITETANALGRATGVVTSVPFTHATPAGYGAQNISRNAYGAISEEMIHNTALDLILGAGNPLYDSNGNLRETPDYGYMSETAWNTLNNADSPRTLIQTKAEFEALADGSLKIDGPLIGLPQVYDTLQYNRNGDVVGYDDSTPTGKAYIEGVPTLETMTRGALNYLSQNENGFFVMIEGGAVDWAAHATDTLGLIEEQVDFNLSVDTAVNWVNTHSSWEETLLIVLTDHGNGMPMGPDSDTIPFQPIQNNGQGNIPGVKWHFDNHTNENTLFFAHGAGADLFYDYVLGFDFGLYEILGFNDGRYIDNTAVSLVIGATLAPAVSVPEPETYALVLAGLGLLGFVGRRRDTHTR